MKMGKKIIDKKSKSEPKPAVVDLFCGVGGLSHGFVQEGFDLCAGIDFDESCRFAYEKNNKAKFYHKDLTHTPSKFVSSLFPENSIKILIGCAPCTSFSLLTQKYKDHDQWRLLYSFARIIKDVNPDIVSMENVPRLLEYQNGKIFKHFLSMLNREGFQIHYEIVNCPDYGIPQKRQRLILLASKLGEISLIRKTHSPDRYVTVRKAIAHLPAINAGEICATDPLHRSRGLSSLNLRRIRNTSEGGSWAEWDDDLKLSCHLKDSGKSFRSVYGRMKWDDIAPTLTTLCTGYGNGRYGHPTQDRAISLREAAIIQSFPENYQFIDTEKKVIHSHVETHIGNAVPVMLARVIAKSIKRHLKAVSNKNKIHGPKKVALGKKRGFS